MGAMKNRARAVRGAAVAAATATARANEELRARGFAVLEKRPLR